MPIGGINAPFGFRNESDNKLPKGHGFLGDLKRSAGAIVGSGQISPGVSTELSVSADIGGKQISFPLIVPSLGRDEINYLLSTPPGEIFKANPQIAHNIFGKAAEHAISRINRGLSPFLELNQ